MLHKLIVSRELEIKHHRSKGYDISELSTYGQVTLVYLKVSWCLRFKKPIKDYNRCSRVRSDIAVGRDTMKDK